MPSALATKDGPGTSARASVLIVDDSVVARGLFGRWVSENPLLELVGITADGLNAVRLAGRLKPDLIILDLDMPVMDGLTALPEILKVSPRSSVVIASTLTARSARLSLQCLTLGAIDIQSKPDTNRDLTMSQSFRQELMRKLEGLIGTRGSRTAAGLQTGSAKQLRPVSPDISTAPRWLEPGALRFETSPRLIVIGASTGGPKAVATVLSDMKDTPEKVPVILIQHMPAVFTASLAEQLQNRLGRPVREALHGEVTMPGTIYVAPGGQHLRLMRADRQVRMQLDDSAPVRFCRPSLDLTFSDAAQQFGASTLAVVLTGMGNDGLEGARLLRQSGATMIVQDEATSTVWGMPGSISREGLAQHVLPVEQIGGAIHAAIRSGTST